MTTECYHSLEKMSPLDWMNCSKSASYFCPLLWKIRLSKRNKKWRLFFMMPTLKKGTLSGVVKHLAQGNNLHFLSFVVSGSIMMLTQLYSPLLFVRRKNKVFCDGYYLHLLSSFTLFFLPKSVFYFIEHLFLIKWCRLLYQ